MTCPRSAIPDDPDEVILFSVDGTKESDEHEAQGAPERTERLHNYPVLGRVNITDPERRREVVTAVKHDIRDGYSSQSKCFFPRHVLRVIKGGTTVDVVICFQCHNYELRQDGARPHSLTPAIGESSKSLLNKILTDAGVPIAP